MLRASQDDLLLGYLASALAAPGSPRALRYVFTRKLRLLFSFDQLGLLVPDASQQQYCLALLDYQGEVVAPTQLTCGGQPRQDALLTRFLAQPQLRQHALGELLPGQPATGLAKILVAQGLPYLTVVPLRAAGYPSGLLVLLGCRPMALAPADSRLLERIGGLAAILPRLGSGRLPNLPKGQTLDC